MLKQIDYLKEYTPEKKLWKLHWSNAMALAAKDYCDNLVASGSITETGVQPRKTDDDASLVKFGGWRKFYGQSTLVGPSRSAVDIIMSLFLDDNDFPELDSR